jgi:hypothetical protein
MLAQDLDRLAAERWIDEGGRLAPEAVIEREIAARLAADPDALRGPKPQETPGASGELPDLPRQ